MGGGRLYGLDALRSVAAIAVALHHWGRIFDFQTVGPAIAVDLFFILSGFVMTRTYEARLRGGELSTPGFIALRYRRLFWPLAVGSTVGLITVASLIGPSISLALAYMLILGFLPVAAGPTAFLLNGPAWSLFVEIVSNVLHGAILARISNAPLLALIGACALLSTLCFASGVGIWSPSITSILWLIPRELACYLVGIWICRRYGDAPLGNRPGWAIAAFVAALCLSSINSAFEIASLIACPFIIRASLGQPRAQWAAWAGAISYPLYATHVPVMQAARALGWLAPAGLVLAVAVATAVTLIFETRRDRPAISYQTSG